MLFKRRFNRQIALEVITEGILLSTCANDAAYVKGLCAMARELGLINKKEFADLTAEAERKIHNKEG